MSVGVLQFELYCYRTYCAIVLKTAGSRNFSIFGPQIGCIDTDILSHFYVIIQLVVELRWWTVHWFKHNSTAGVAIWQVWDVTSVHGNTECVFLTTVLLGCTDLRVWTCFMLAAYSPLFFLVPPCLFSAPINLYLQLLAIWPSCLALYLLALITVFTSYSHLSPHIPSSII